MAKNISQKIPKKNFKNKKNQAVIKMKPALSRKTSSIKSRTTKSLLINLDDFAEPLVAIPPDGGWGWVIVAASFFVMFCVDGVGYCFALYFEDISKEFNCEITEVAVTASVLGGFYYLVGPLTCSAINRFGFQIIGVLGGIVATASFLSASFVNSITLFVVVVGIFGGIGFNFIYTPSIIALGFYFERWRALAMAIVCCGSSLGIMTFPIMMTKVFGHYHWRRKFQIISGMLAVCSFLGLTYRPIKSMKVERTVQFGEVSALPSLTTMDYETEMNTGGAFISVLQRFKNTLFPTISEVSLVASYSSRPVSRTTSKTSGLAYLLHRQNNDPDVGSTYMTVNPNYYSEENRSMLFPVEEEDSSKDVSKRCCYRCCRNCKECCCSSTCFRTSQYHVNRPMYRDDIFFTGSVYTLPLFSRPGSHISGSGLQRGSHRIASLAYTLSVSRAPTQKDIMQQGQCVCCPEAVIRVLVTMLDFQMLKSPTFILLLISGFLTLMGTYTCFSYIAMRGLEEGIAEGTAKMLLSVLGIANTVGRATCGAVSCFPILDINIVSWVSIGICGCMALASAAMTTSLHYYIFCSIFGFLLATFAVFRAVQFVELFGLENLTNCFGLNMVFQALAAFTAIPIANLIHQKTKQFKPIFIFTGVIILVSAVMLIPIRRILKWEQRNQKKKVTFNG